MTQDKKDHWSSEVSSMPRGWPIQPKCRGMPSRTDSTYTLLAQAYQHSASFVPKLAGKIMQWLDPQEDDVILDIGCGGNSRDVRAVYPLQVLIDPS